MTKQLPLLFPFLVTLGCNDGELPGNYWNISVSGAENLCTGSGTGYSENYDYRIELELSDATLFIAEDQWATGILDGCEISYESIEWSDLRDGYEIRWRLNGLADINIGGPGAGCVEQEGYDWVGTETFTVLSSAHPNVQSGCTYTLDVVGQWDREVEGK